jgi:hypothetical protein
MTITIVVIDPYIKATNWGANLFEFYEYNKELDKVYILGNSLVVLGVDPVIVQNKLQDHNLSYNVYSLAYEADMPSHRIFEINNIIKSNPEIVVIAFPYYWLYSQNPPESFGDNYLERRFLMASDKIILDQYIKSQFNGTILGKVKTDIVHLISYKRQYLSDGTRLLVSNFGFIDYVPIKSAYDQFNFKNQRDPGNKTQKSFKAECPIISTPDNQNKRCLTYIIRRLKEHKINVILLQMPVNPGYLLNCTRKQQEIISNFASTTGCPYYDLTALCPEGDFLDYVHANSLGRRNITIKMAEILLKEAKNVTQ